MFILKDIKLTTVPAIWLLLSGLVLIVLLTIYIYRKTNPIVSNWTRYTLITLRVCALFITLFIVFDPILSSVFSKKETSTIAILLDNSASMKLKDSGVKRDSVLNTVISQDIFKKLSKKHKIKYFQFGGSVKPLGQEDLTSIRFDGDATNISKSLAQVKEDLLDDYLSDIILVSDGAYNIGGNPVREMNSIGVPLYTIGIGSAKEPHDIGIKEINSNKFSYLGDSTPIEVKVQNNGYGKTNTVITLKRKGEVVDRQKIVLPKSPSTTTAILKYVPQQEGTQKYNVEIAELEGEQTYLNNRRSFNVEVLKSKIRILMISGTVNADLGFLRRFFEKNEDFTVQTLIEKEGGTFYPENPKYKNNLDDYDVLFFLDFPTRYSSSQFISKLIIDLNDNPIPIITILGSSTNPSLLSKFERFLPLRSVSNTSETLVRLTPTMEGIMNPLLSIGKDDTENERTWQMLPPLFQTVSSVKPWPDTQVLAICREQNPGKPRVIKKDSPAIISRFSEQRRSLMILTHGLWRWDLMMAGIGDQPIYLEKLLNNMIRWITIAKEEKKVTISSNSDSYSFGEPIILTAEVYDNEFNPLDNADVRVFVKREDMLLQQLTLRSTGRGHYQGELDVDLPGEYHFSGKAILGQRELGVDSGRFEVGHYEAELTDTRAQLNLLKQLALETEGNYFSPDSVGYLSDFIKSDVKILKKQVEIELWNKYYFLILIILLLCFEWYLRKRKGMV